MITGYEGLPGQGKTLNAVRQLWEIKKKGGRVAANIPLIDWRVKREREFWFFGPRLALKETNPRTFGKSWTDVPQLMKLEECFLLDNVTILLDEMHLWCPATEWDKMPAHLRVQLAQQRHDGIDFLWTAQNMSNVFNVARQLTWCCWKATKWGRVCQLLGRDPQCGEVIGKKLVPINSQIYDLYDSWNNVGTRDGKIAPGEGKSRRKKMKPGQLLQLARENLHAPLGLEGQLGLSREVDEWGAVRYRRAAGGDLPVEQESSELPGSVRIPAEVGPLCADPV